MSKGVKVKKEEYTTLGDFLNQSYGRDLDRIKERYPKLDETYRDEFVSKLGEVKQLESSLQLTEEQKNATKSLREEADLLNKELNFLSSYCQDAGLSRGIVTDLKKKLTVGNIEGAVLKIEDLKQFVANNQNLLLAEGMSAGFMDDLAKHKASMEKKNMMQNIAMNARKILTEQNHKQYDDLYGYISKIARSGKLVFADSVVKDEYTISKIVARMRGGK